MKNNFLILKAIIVIIILSLFLTSCEKYLDTKAQQVQAVPETLTDLQAILNNSALLNSNSLNIGEAFSDNYYLTPTTYNASTLLNQQRYTWDGNFVEVTETSGWFRAYQSNIYTSNVVLELLSRIPETTSNKSQRDDIKGQALFYRSFLFYSLAQIYCRPYSSSSSTDLGIVLKLTGDINEKSKRATVAETYSRIIEDLKEAEGLLYETTTFATRPTKAAALALLARTYLSMRDYSNAKSYAIACLQKRNKIVDYNTLVPAKVPPFQILNDEVIFHSVALATASLPTAAKIDPALYQAYSINDLRKTLFFIENTGTDVGTYAFRGSYNGALGQSVIWDGLTTSEMLLIKAECLAREGQKDAALADLNALMIKRWNNANNSWSPLTAATAEEAKNLILLERRKELVYRTLRWTDIRRLNLEGANITLYRTVNGQTFSLPPNDLRSVLLIPNGVINSAGIEQNPR